MDYYVMAEDVVRKFSDLEKFHVIGHAMGGKLAIALAVLYPDKVESVISLEAAPVDNTKYDPELLQKNIQSMNELLSLEIQGKTRKTVIDMLNDKYEDKGLAALVSMNIIYDGDQSNTVKWCTNIQGIRDNIDKITA